MEAIKTGLIVDSYYFRKCQSDIGDIDIAKLVEFLAQNDCRLIRKYWFTSYNEPSISQFYAWLKTIGFEIIIKGTKSKTIECNDCGYANQFTVEKGVDIAIATKAIELACKATVDRLAIISGDGDMEEAYKFVRDGLDSEIIIVGNAGTISPDIIPYASRVIYLNEILPSIKKL